ncbi:MAG: hypothetical protein Q8N60_04275 [Candidatus Diapherotrites archaeon]|nr:hypothetical protein [Candidatus Diapherotrites archaeon]
MNWKNILFLSLLIFFAGNVAAVNIDANVSGYLPAPASPNSTITLWVQLKNNSTFDAADAMVKLEINYPLSLQPGQENEMSLGKMGPYTTKIVEYKILVDPKAVDGKYDVKIYSGDASFQKITHFRINIVSRTPKLEIIESDVTRLEPGQVATVKLLIKNIGGGIAKNIAVKTTEDRTVTSTGVVVEREIVSLGAGTKYIEYLDPEQQTTVEMQLAVNEGAELKNYSVPIKMEYYDTNGTAKTDTGYIGLKITASPNVDAVIRSVTPYAFPGTTAEITIDLFNIGPADAKYVTVELNGEGVEIAEPKQFIGTLEADDFDSFKTSAKFSQTVQPGQQLPITLKIIYKDPDQQTQVKPKELSLKVLTAAEMQATAGIGPAAIIIGLFFLAIQLIGLYAVARFGYRKFKQFRGKKGK